jgi:hypothetical protein
LRPGLKAAFGAQEIDLAIERGRNGEATFFACENGRSVGTSSTVTTNAWQVTGALDDRYYCAGCDGSCTGTERRCSWR